MPRIDEMPDYRAKLPKSVHDLSHKFGFTATVAHLLPVFHDFVNPGETVELAFNYNLRTQPLQSAAMVDIIGHVEYFFVPMQLIYEPFGSMYYNLNDNYSSNFPAALGNSQAVQDQFPVMDFSYTVDGLLDEMQSDDSTIVGFEEWYNHVYRLFDMLGFNNSGINRSGVNWNPNVFPYAILAYNCIYQYYYRLDNREHFNQRKFNWDRFYNQAVVNRNDLDFMEFVRLYYRPKDSDYFTDIKVSPIVDVLNLNVKGSLAVANQWLTRNVVTNGAGSQQPVLRSGFPGSDNGLGYGDVSPMSDTNYPINNIQTQFGFNRLRINQPTTGQYVVNGLDFNTANIRAMFASEKLWSITGRARKHYDDQTLAHFGVKVPHDVKHEISCFGHDRSRIHIGEVIATSNVVVNSGGSVVNGGLGEIAGKGYGQMQNKPHKFTAPCHGVVMAILSYVPTLTYGGAFQKCNVMTSRNDLYQPEYDHLGMQPIFHYEGGDMAASTRAGIAGWQYRYEQWKRRFNRVSKAFTGNGSLDSWMLDFVPAAKTQNNLANSGLVSNYLDFLHSPSELNQIMLVNYITAASGYSAADESKVYDGDPFVIDGYVHCKKVSTMSDYSLPRLDA